MSIILLFRTIVFFAIAAKICLVLASTVGESCAGDITICNTPGHYCNVAINKCANSPIGTYAQGDGASIDCPAGTKNGATGQTSLAACGNCAIGKYSTTGASVCSDCNAGTTTVSGGTVGTSQAACQDCDPGKYATSAGGGCTNCQTGRYSVGGAPTVACT